MKSTKIKSLADLIASINQNEPQILELEQSVLSPYSITLPRGYQLIGKNKDESILSFQFGDGLGLTADNLVSNLTILAQPTQRAIFTQTGCSDMGEIVLKNLSLIGQVSVITRAGTQNLKFIADDIHVVFADTRHYSEQPQKYNVNVYQGAVTVYNFNADKNSKIIANLSNISVGMKNAPCYGSGIFISGFGDQIGTVHVEKLTTGNVYSHGMLPYGTADIITAAVFIVYGVVADYVEHNGEIVTYGVNDMVLDTWGTVDRWVCNKPIRSYGPSGIGFVNFGTVNHFIANDDIVTYGLGARGFNQYDGTVNNIQFKSITTWGDGSIGIQISKPIGNLTVLQSVITHGGVGNSLVKGVIMQLPAYGISIKPGGLVQSLKIKGNIETNGDEICSYTVEGGEVKNIVIEGEVIANGKESIGIEVKEDGKTPLENIKIKAPLGKEFSLIPFSKG